jgi:hypothetical protein
MVTGITSIVMSFIFIIGQITLKVTKLASASDNKGNCTATKNKARRKKEGIEPEEPRTISAGMVACERGRAQQTAKQRREQKLVFIFSCFWGKEKKKDFPFLFFLYLQCFSVI